MVNKDDIALAEIIDDIAVMNDFVKYINRRREEIQRALDNINGAHHARAKPARLCQDDFLNTHSVSLRQKLYTCRLATPRLKAIGNFMLDRQKLLPL